MPQSTREYIERVERDESLPPGERLKLLTMQGLWSERLWQEVKMKVQAEMVKHVAAEIPKQAQAPEGDLVRVKLDLMDPKTRLMMETINFLSKKYPNTPTDISRGFLRWNRELLNGLMEHLRKKGLILA